jgi:hypothetical protein
MISKTVLLVFSSFVTSLPAGRQICALCGLIIGHEEHEGTTKRTKVLIEESFLIPLPPF